MRVLLPLALLFFLSSSFISADAQDITVVQVGVPALRSGVNAVSVTEARDRLVKALNQQKPNKLSHVSIRAIPLDAPPGPLALAEANRKKCLFVVSTHLTNLATSTEVSQYDRLPSAPVYHATVEYQINRVADGSGVAVGSIETEDSNSSRDSIWRALSQVSAKAAADLLNGRNISDGVYQAGNNSPQQPVPQRIEVLQMGTDSCAWLPNDIPHAVALRGACEYAIGMSRQMPNLICDEAASRYRGNDRVATDLITTSLRYEDGNETYSALTVNGKPAPDAITQSPGLWSKGEFASNNLRSLFDPRNQARFDFSRDTTFDRHPVWIFTYQVAQQNDPLWRLHQGDQSVAPPYAGEVWIDQQTGAVLHFRATANDIPDSFPMAGAEEQLGYQSVAFEDGSSLVLPTDFTVSTTYRGDVATRNVVRLTNCHKFRAKARMLFNVTASSDENKSSGDTADAASVQRDLEHNNEIYSILQQQAIREDEARLEGEQELDLRRSTNESIAKYLALDRQRLPVLAQQGSASSLQAGIKDKDPLTTFKVKVNLVPVSVVLRNSSGRAVGNYSWEDFHLFDDRKPQVISSFTVEHSGSPGNELPPAPSQNAGVTHTSVSTPERDVAYVFDDLNGASDLANAKEAARRHIAGLQPGDQAAIVSTSGQVQLDFTGDREKLLHAIQSLKPYPPSTSTCPPISYYTADLMLNKRDPDVNSVALVDAVVCIGGNPNSILDRDRAQRTVTAKAFEVLNAGNHESLQALSVLRDVIRHTASMPGKRSIVLASPGFLTLDPDTLQAVATLIEQAIRADIVINALDIRGLYPAGMDASRGSTADPALRLRLDTEEAGMKSNVMADLAYGTGGTFFEHNNDLDEGFRRTADAPEYVYLLGFEPQKLDGKLHKLKVTVNGSAKLKVQTRQGYYALKPEPPK
jgi:VWFA-related protein